MHVSNEANRPINTLLMENPTKISPDYIYPWLTVKSQRLAKFVRMTETLMWKTKEKSFRSAYSEKRIVQL